MMTVKVKSKYHFQIFLFCTSAPPWTPTSLWIVTEDGFIKIHSEICWKTESLSRFYWCIFCLAKVQSEGGLQTQLRNQHLNFGSSLLSSKSSRDSQIMEDKEKIVDEATIVKPNMASDRMKMILL